MVFQLENSRIERQIVIENGVPVRSVVTNKISGAQWASDGKDPVIRIPGVALEGSSVRIEDTAWENGEKQSALVFLTAEYELRWEMKLWEDPAVIESRIGVKRVPGGKCVRQEQKVCGSGGEGCELQERNSLQEAAKPQEGDYIDGCGSTSRHVDLKAVQFFDRTDEADQLVEERESALYSRGRAGYDGHLFILQEKISGEALLWVKNAPCEVAQFHRKGHDFTMNTLGNLHLCGSGISPEEVTEEAYLYAYSTAVGVCERGGAEALFRQYYQKDYVRKATVNPHYIMSNTWGDRNCDKCVCEEFMRKEIETAARLGCDIVQIDDGWQKGITANSALASGGVWNGKFRLTDPDFWTPHPAKFPNGFEPIVRAAAEKGVELGLWFSPDNENDYGDWELDADVMIGFFRQYGIRYFKIDGVVIRNHLCVENMLKMFDKVQKSCAADVVFNMDITNGKRFGYLFHRQIGDIFVENRYTDFGNYYPHNTLRNLWELAQYLPVERLQMEVLNHRRRQDRYEDILAPANYDIDYLFASVMAAKPLLWMEMSELEEEDKERLEKLITVYKKYRNDFGAVMPIREKPDGFSCTGFRICGRENDYVILLREQSEEGTFTVPVKEILATNDPELKKKGSYLFGIADREAGE